MKGFIGSMLCVALITTAFDISAQSDGGGEASLVWKDASGEGRQQVTLFRRGFQLTGQPESAELRIFADSRYHLYVNGDPVNFGPSRFYRAHPEYDVIDLLPWLQEGENLLAVEVLGNGTETYQVPLGRAALWASGRIRIADGTIDLSTPGDWLMKPGEAFDQEALRFSFACGPMEIFDGRRQDEQWKRVGYDDTHWSRPLVLEEQDYWGEMSPRTLPFLSADQVEAFELLGIYADAPGERLYRFFRKTPDRTNRVYNKGQELFMATWVHSPREQEVSLGSWWGDFYLNGERHTSGSMPDPDNPVRVQRSFQFQKGWNALFIRYVAIWGGWDFYLAVPEESGLILSANRKKNDKVFCRSGGPSPGEASLFEPATGDAGDLKALFRDKRFAWKDETDLPEGANPAREMVWQRLDVERNQKSNDHQTGGFSSTEPRTYVFDMGRKMLGSVFVELEAPEGTVVDLGWTEDLDHRGMPYLYKRLQINSGARFISAGGKQRYETFKPYGVRYLQVRISPAGGEAKLQRCGVVERIYPYEKKGSFECSSSMLNRIWELGWRSLRVCSEDSYTDTPFRERGLYAGDALPEYAISLATSGDSRLMKRSLLLFRDMYAAQMLEGKQEGLGDFVLKTLVELHWYYQVTGDRELLELLYPHYASLMEHIEEGQLEEGFYPTSRVFFEWTRIDKKAYLTAYQALLSHSFSLMSELAEELERQEESRHFAQKAGELAMVVNSTFWDGEKGAYIDGYRDGEITGSHYPISSVYPLLFGLPDTEQRALVMEHLETELQDIGEETRNRRITPYGSFYLFSSLYREGEAALAERFMLQYWSRMIHQGDDTSWENFDIGGEQNGGGQGTASHAWSGHPTFFLSTEALGVQLGFPGSFDPTRIEIRPQSELLEWARGWVPHPAGMVHVDWRIQGEKLKVELVIPPGVAHEFEPRGRLASYPLELEVKIGNPF